MDAYSDWTHDLCLYCDTVATDGAYCSEACRVADFRQAMPAQQHLHIQQQHQQDLLLQSQLSIQSPYALPTTFHAHSADPQLHHSSSRNSSLSSTPTTSTTTTSAPASMLNLPSYQHFSLSELSPSSKTCPPSPFFHPSSYFAATQPLSSSHVDNSFGLPSQQDSQYVSSESYSTLMNLESRLSTSHTHVLKRSFSSNVQALNNASHLSQAARRELKRYDDSFDHSRRRRQRTMP